METLTLKSLRFHAFHGYYEEEQQKGNDFEVDLILTANLQKAGESDQLQDTIDYQQVVVVVSSVMKAPPVKLIETLANRIGNKLLSVFPTVQTISVAVRKLHPPLEVETAYSEISMSWQR